MHTRYSARKYDSQHHVPNDVVEKILACGLNAPSSKNAQPWCFHVVRSAELRGVLAEAILNQPDLESYVPRSRDSERPYQSSVAESARILAEAPVAIFVENLGCFTGGRASLAGHPEQLVGSLVSYTFEVVGLGAAIENLLLAAHALGLGAVFMGDVLVIEDEIRNRLSIIGDLVGVVALGYATASRFSSKELHRDRVVYHD